MKRLITISLLILFTLSLYGTTLKIWAMGEEAKKLPLVIEDFEKENPGVTVKVQALPWSSAFEKLLTGVAGRQLPDIAQMGTTWMSSFSAMGAFQDLRKYIAKSDVVSEEKFFPGSWATCVYRGKVYGIPWYVDTRVLFYRTDLLAEVGYNEAPKNWDELYDAAKKLAQRPEMYGLTLQTNEIQEFIPFVWQNNATVIDENNELRVNDPKFKEALDFYARFFEENIVPKAGSGNVFQDFATGFVPMFFTGPWMVSMMHEQVPQIDGKWAVALMPQKVTRTSFMGGSDWVIFKTSKNKDLAWKFIEFMSRPDVQFKWYQILKSLPAVKEVWEYPELKDDPFTSVFGEQLKDARATPNIPEWEKIESIVERKLEERVLGKITTEKAVEDMVKEISKILK
ncbi:sugar ABC transporter substrate-binding protein [Kosmotoga pacifica]|uniref:ABC transporter substrate-binding protein n=1 Tax=Kosmotoga pacifica TaxID=1330330 RepID=A0A0G2Z849_9BACT|nr:sugar ABC transporter substrate-binding protein [Kosmotoga pacifica]AKI97790.1 hypothetical protein IX53_08165 [Kosmotoga pacifica]